MKAGAFSAEGASAELLCEVGTHQPARGQSSCVACSAGHACPAGSASQTACERGSYGDTSDWVCKLCAGGSYQPNTTQTSCVPCPAGSSCAVGSTEPAACAPGTIAATVGQSQCAKCDAGTF